MAEESWKPVALLRGSLGCGGNMQKQAAAEKLALLLCVQVVDGPVPSGSVEIAEHARAAPQLFPELLK